MELIRCNSGQLHHTPANKIIIVHVIVSVSLCLVPGRAPHRNTDSPHTHTVNRRWWYDNRKELRRG